MGSARPAELAARVARLERARDLHALLDERLEVALVKRQPLERVLPALLEI